MAPPVLLFLFLIWSGTEGAWRLPSFSFVFDMVEDGRDMAPPVLLFLFFI